MMDWLAQQNEGMLIPLVAITGGVLIVIVSVVSRAWSRVRCAEMQARQAEADAALKQQMIERGMSAEEIERVLAAGQSKTPNQHALVGERVA